MNKFFKQLQTKEMLFGSGALFLFLASLFVIVALVGSIIMLAHSGDTQPQNVITVTGTGEVDAVPDIAQFTFTARAERNDVQQAQQVVNEQVNKVLQDLYRLGVEEKDVKTISRSANERYEYRSEVCRAEYCPPQGKRTLVGYEVTQHTQVKVRELDNLGAIDAIFGEHDIADYYGPNYTIEDPDELQTQAKEAAIADGKAEAQRLAKKLGVRLGKLVNYNEGGGMVPMYRTATMSAAMDSDMEESASSMPQLPSGEQTVSAQVTLTYKIK